jgi:hypothetical protein
VAGHARLATDADLDLVAGWVPPYTLDTFGAIAPNCVAVARRRGRSRLDGNPPSARGRRLAHRAGIDAARTPTSNKIYQAIGFRSVAERACVVY